MFETYPSQKSVLYFPILKPLLEFDMIWTVLSICNVWTQIQPAYLFILTMKQEAKKWSLRFLMSQRERDYLGTISMALLPGPYSFCFQSGDVTVKSDLEGDSKECLVHPFNKSRVSRGHGFLFFQSDMPLMDRVVSMVLNSLHRLQAGSTKLSK